MRRREDWPERLGAVVDAARRRPFEWGRFDCALFAADAVAAMTGEDLAAPFRGRYRTRAGASRALRRAGYESLEALCMALLGQPLDTPTLAQRGDVVLLEAGNGPQLGVCVGAQAAAPCEGEGLVFAPLSLWRTAWRV